MFSTKKARRALVNRRMIRSTSVWATHVAVAGLAALWSTNAASAPASYVLDWGTTSYSQASNGLSGSARITSASTPSATPVTMSVASKFSGAMHAASSGTDFSNLTTSPGTIGGTSQQGLTLMQSFTHSSRTNGTRANRQSVTFTFSQPVSNLSFVISDVDSQRYNFWDVVEISSKASFTATTDAGVTGGAKGPWSQKSNNTSINSALSGGDISVHFTSPVTTFTLVTWNKQTAVVSYAGSQGVFVGDMSFTADSTR